MKVKHSNSTVCRWNSWTNRIWYSYLPAKRNRKILMELDRQRGGQIDITW